MRIKDEPPGLWIWYGGTATGLTVSLLTDQWWWVLIGFFGGLALVFAWALVKACIVIHREHRTHE